MRLLKDYLITFYLVFRIMEFSNDDGGFVMTMSHEKTDIVAKRHFKRL